LSTKHKVAAAGILLGPETMSSPHILSDPDNGYNSFTDSVGGGGLDSVQTFTISPTKKYDFGSQFPVAIRYGNAKDYGSQHIWQPSANQPVLINGYPQLPAAPGPLKGEY
jgi:hypothetical protein